MEKTALIIATVALTIFGSIVVLALFLSQQKNNEVAGGMTYSYDEQNRLQSVQPMRNNFVKLVPVGDEHF